MKCMITVLITLFTLAVSAQTVTISFQGAANKPRNYQVVIDDVSYFSVNGITKNGRKITTINNLSEGSHHLKLYTSSNTNSSSIDGSTVVPATKALYTKTFQLREGYDMNILVKGNGQVSFTEKVSPNAINNSSRTPMASGSFNTLVQKVSGRRYQSDRITLVKNALNSTSNYFTTTQIRQLLTLITAESRRLELAKLSYNKVTDQANFSSVYDVLKSEASRDALDNYVVDQGGTLYSSENNAAYGIAISDASYTSLLNRVKSYSYQSGRIAEIRAAFESNNYFTVAQVRELLTQLNLETDRLSLVKLAFGRVTEPSAYNQLADLFYVQSNRNEFNNFVVSNGGVANNSPYLQHMSDAAFQQIYDEARGHFFQKNTVADIKTAFSNTANYFSTEQIRYLMQLVNNESSRLELVKLGFPRTVDVLNDYSLEDLFTLHANRTAFQNFISSKQ